MVEAKYTCDLCGKVETVALPYNKPIIYTVPPGWDGRCMPGYALRLACPACREKAKKAPHVFIDRDGQIYQASEHTSTVWRVRQEEEAGKWAKD